MRLQDILMTTAASLALTHYTTAGENLTPPPPPPPADQKAYDQLTDQLPGGPDQYPNDRSSNPDLASSYGNPQPRTPDQPSDLQLNAQTPYGTTALPSNDRLQYSRPLPDSLTIPTMQNPAKKRITSAHILEVNSDDDLRSVLDILRRRIENVESQEQRLKMQEHLARRLGDLGGKVTDYLKVVEDFVTQQSKNLEDLKKKKENTPELDPALTFYSRVLLNATNKETFSTILDNLLTKIRNADDQETLLKVARELKKKLEGLQKRATRELESTKSDIEKLQKRIDSDKVELDKKIKAFDDKVAKEAAEKANQSKNKVSEKNKNDLPVPEERELRDF